MEQCDHKIRENYDRIQLITDFHGKLYLHMFENITTFSMHSKDELIELTHIIFPITSKKPGFGKRQEILKPINMCNRVMISFG